jgi:two-component system, OmpR family, response regulator ResD
MTEPQAARRRVLVVDDEPEITDVLLEYLAPAYDVEAAADATQAIASVRARRPDLIFLDINMPGIDGVQALSLIKEMDPTIPILMVTANTDTDVAAQAIKLGAFSYIPKPFNLKYVEHLMMAAWSR